MAPEPPMPRRWRDLVEEAQRRNWVSSQAVQGLLDAAAAAERAGEAPSAPTPPIVLPFTAAPPVPDEVVRLSLGAAAPGAALDAAAAARLLAEDAIQAVRRAGAGSGSGGAKGARRRKWLEATPEGKAWLIAVKALRRTIERLGLADRAGVRGHPGAGALEARAAARKALLGGLQAAYERLGYPPPPPPTQDA